MINHDEGFDYAWNWFKYHANQRMQELNYFLIIIAGILYGISTVIGKSNAVLFLYGLFGLIISIAFFMLDLRNEQLVGYGQNAIKEHEKAFKEEGFKILTKDEKEKCYLTCHKYWLKILYGSSILLFLFILLYLIINRNIIIIIINNIR